MYRLEAEAMLGPEGKRCRKCNPVVVDLMDEGGDSDSEGVLGGERDEVEAAQE